MKLKTAEIRRFFSNCSTIKSKGVLPVLDYIKVDNDKIIKTNLSAYVVMSITPTGKTMLISENVLNGVIKQTTADVIEITVKGNIATISDGRNKPTFAISPEEHYPEMPDNEKEGEVVLSQEVLEAIGIAAKNTATNDVRPAFNHVNLGFGYVASSDSNRVFLKQFEGLPTALIDPLAANIICQFGEVKYYSKGNYNFFEVGSFLFGFAKSESKPVDLTKYLADTQKETYIEFYCHEIFNFVELFMSFSGGEEVVFDFSGDELSFHDVDRQVSNEVILSTEGNYKPKICLLPRLLNGLLKSLGREKIRMSPLKTAPGVLLWDADDPELFCFLSLINKLK